MTQGPTQTRGKIAVFDLVGTLHFTGSVALAVAAQAHTRAQWRDYDDSAVLNAVYSVLAWKQKPGFVDVDQDWPKIRRHQGELWTRYINAFMERAARSPREAVEYLETLETLKSSSLGAMNATFAEVAAINAEIFGEMTKAIHRLAAIKCAGVLIVAGTTMGVAAMGLAVAAEASTIGVGLSVGLSVAKNLGEAKDAQAVAVDPGEILDQSTQNIYKDAAKASAMNWIAQPMGEGLVRWLATRPGVVAAAERLGLNASLNGAVAEYSRQLAVARTAARKMKLSGRIAERQVARQASIKGMGRVVSRGIPIIFCVNDILGALDEYAADTR